MNVTQVLTFNFIFSLLLKTKRVTGSKDINEEFNISVQMKFEEKGIVIGPKTRISYVKKTQRKGNFMIEFQVKKIVE